MPVGRNLKICKFQVGGLILKPKRPLCSPLVLPCRAMFVSHDSQSFMLEGYYESAENMPRLWSIRMLTLDPFEQ